MAAGRPWQTSRLQGEEGGRAEQASSPGHGERVRRQETSQLDKDMIEGGTEAAPLCIVKQQDVLGEGDGGYRGREKGPRPGRARDPAHGQDLLLTAPAGLNGRIFRCP